jgi:hypothetical protein
MTLDELAQRLEVVDARVDALEARPSMQYRGVWSAATLYVPGTVVTDHGCMWHANAPNRNHRPGQSETWTLCCKAGRNGKDAR